MKQVTQQHEDAWLSGDYTGNRRPMARATIQKMHMKIRSGGEGHQSYAEYLFNQPDIPRELPNLKSVRYDRSVATDAATCTLELYNTEPLPTGTALKADDLGNYQYAQPGYYTFNRGKTTHTNRWRHNTNQWQSTIVPDRLIRTYEGYGFDGSVGPDYDNHMNQSGVWLIDTVEYNANGIITVNCRDAGRLLIEQIMFPPVVPKVSYPLSYTSKHQVADPPTYSTTGGWMGLTYTKDSNIPYTGFNGSVSGHRPTDAFDGNASSYWMSIGNSRPDADYAYEYIEGSVPNKDVTAVKFHVAGGPYTYYVSIRRTGQTNWEGTAEIPYNERASAAAPNGANIDYVVSGRVGAEQELTVNLGKFVGVDRVRVTFTNLWNSRIGQYPYRAAVRSIAVSTAVTTTNPATTHTEGNYSDYSEIVKRLCGYGGWYWPREAATGYQMMTDGQKKIMTAPMSDPYVGHGRIWGDIEMTGTAGIPGTTLGPEVWDKKPLMDGITYIRDIVSFNFFIDETGGAVFRTPNIWQIGNYVGNNAFGKAYVPGEEALIVIDERETLLELAVTLSSRSQRERVFVANTTGRIGAVSKGHTSPVGPFDTGLRRVAGWTDQHFATDAECQIMADLITLRQLFQYRTDRVTIPGYSAIQIDDQVRIIEGTTAEDFVHYIAGMSSSWDVETGEWTYSLDTHWLGEAPYENWAFNPYDGTLHAETIEFLKTIGAL